MGLLQCKGNHTPTPTKGKSFEFVDKKGSPLLSANNPPVLAQECNQRKASGNESVVVNDHEAQSIKSELEEEARDTLGSNPIQIQCNYSSRASMQKANSYPMGNKVQERRRKNSAPVALSIYYSLSACQVNEKKIDLDESIIGELLSKKPRAISTSQRFHIRRKSSNLSKIKLQEKPKKKVRFDDNVTMHRIEASTGIPSAMPETYKLVVTMREVWMKLDMDKDQHLNIIELRRFCGEVWEEPDSDVYDIMKLYAKEKPEIGMNFNEWCTLIKDEDPELKEFVGDLYTIFVQETDDEE